MRHLLAFLAAVIAASTAHGAPAAPPDIVIVSCRAEPRTQWSEVSRPIPSVEYKQLWINEDNEYECQRVEMNDLQDAYTGEPGHFVEIKDPSNIQFSDFKMCARVGMMKAMEFDQKNPGWLTVAVGCPVPVMDDMGTPSDHSDDQIIDWKLPDCPVFVPGTKNRMTCRFDKSHV